jgi:hypothetical protein|tara:strand:+ start:1089 stop:1445 length:357 start_codon:yes stop_codon:yes gene_type:complete
MGILGKLLGSDAIIKGGMDLIDDMWETDAEKRESKTKAKIDLMTAYAPFKVAQRYLALLFGGTYLVSFFTVLVMTLGSIGDTEAVFTVLEQFKISWIMLTIVGFYFGGGLAESIAPKK